MHWRVLCAPGCGCMIYHSQDSEWHEFFGLLHRQQYISKSSFLQKRGSRTGYRINAGMTFICLIAGVIKEFKSNSSNNKRRTCHEKNMFYLSNGGNGGSADAQRACARFFTDVKIVNWRSCYERLCAKYRGHYRQE